LIAISNLLIGRRILRYFTVWFWFWQSRSETKMMN